MEKIILLSHPRYNQPLQLGVGALEFGLGACIAQIDVKGDPSYIPFSSRSIDEKDRNYWAMGKE